MPNGLELILGPLPVVAGTGLARLRALSMEMQGAEREGGMSKPGACAPDGASSRPRSPPANGSQGGRRDLDGDGGCPDSDLASEELDVSMLARQVCCAMWDEH